MFTKDRFCSECGEAYLQSLYCAKCGCDITPPHKCRGGIRLNSAPRHVCRPRSLHLHKGKFCSKCGKAYPEPRYCTSCGEDITPSHNCMFDSDEVRIHFCRRMLPL